MTSYFLVFGLLLLLAVPILKFVTWSIRDAANQRIKDSMADWYVTFADSNWKDVLFWSSDRAEVFLNSLLGRKLWSFRAFFVWTAISTVYFTLTCWLLLALLEPGAITFLGILREDAQEWLYIPCLVDFLALTASRAAMRRLSAHRIDCLLCKIGALLAIAYAANVLGIFLIALRFYPLDSGVKGINVFAILTMPATALWGLASHIPALVFAALASLMASASVIVLVALMLGALLAYLSRPLSQALLVQLAERLALAAEPLDKLIDQLTFVSAIILAVAALVPTANLAAVKPRGLGIAIAVKKTALEPLNGVIVVRNLDPVTVYDVALACVMKPLAAEWPAHSELDTESVRVFALGAIPANSMALPNHTVAQVCIAAKSTTAFRAIELYGVVSWRYRPLGKRQINDFGFIWSGEKSLELSQSPYRLWAPISRPFGQGEQCCKDALAHRIEQISPKDLFLPSLI